MMSDVRLWSPLRFWSYSAIFLTLYGVATLVGLGEQTSVLAGTNDGSYADHFGGLVYLLLYIATWCVVPVLLISGLICWAAGRYFLERSATGVESQHATARESH